MPLSQEDLERLLAKDSQTKRAPESQTKRRASRAFVRYLVAICIWCRRHLGLAVLRRGAQADNRDQGPGTWLVAGSQGDDRELGPAAWLDEAVGRSRKHCRSALSAGDAASVTRCADCATDGRAESARRPLCRPGTGAADNAESGGAAANRRADRRRSRPDCARNQTSASRRHGTTFQDSSSSATVPRCSRTQTHAGATAVVVKGTNHRTDASPVNLASHLSIATRKTRLSSARSAGLVARASYRNSLALRTARHAQLFALSAAPSAIASRRCTERVSLGP
jgi:hypothetical protein